MIKYNGTSDIAVSYKYKFGRFKALAEIVARK